MENEVPVKKKNGFKELLAPVLASKRKTTIFIVCVVLILLVVGLVVAALTGRFVVVFKGPSQQVSVTGGVCGDDVINKYNDLLPGYYTDDLDQTVVKLNDLVTSFTKNSNYKNDSNCVFISYRVAYLRRDYDRAKEMVDRLSELVNKHQFIDTRLSDLSSVKDIQTALNSIKPATSSNEDSNE